MWIEIIGWLGMVLLLANFGLASCNILKDTATPYHLLNLLGAIGVMINAFDKKVMAVGFVEVAWSLIALVGIVNVYRYARRSL